MAWKAKMEAEAHARHASDEKCRDLEHERGNIEAMVSDDDSCIMHSLRSHALYAHCQLSELVISE